MYPVQRFQIPMTNLPVSESFTTYCVSSQRICSIYSRTDWEFCMDLSTTVRSYKIHTVYTRTYLVLLLCTIQKICDKSCTNSDRKMQSKPQSPLGHSIFVRKSARTRRKRRLNCRQPRKMRSAANGCRILVIIVIAHRT